MNKERLSFLAVKLRENADNPEGMKFDLSDFFAQLDKEKPISCGTVGCAAGLAALLPEFQAQGLKPVLDQRYFGKMAFVPEYEGSRGFEAMEAFFDISFEQGRMLFHPSRYSATHQQGADGERFVADKIDALIAGKNIRYME